jgi:hypothetical protein
LPRGLFSCGAMMRFFSLCVLLSASLHAADQYELRMFRPNKVGSRMAVTGSFAEDRKTEIKTDGKLLREEEVKMDVDYAFEREVLAVSQEGRITSQRLKLLKLTGQMNGKPADQVSAGDSIVVTREGTTQKITVNGEAATKEQENLVKGWGKVSSANGATNDDDLFGAQRKVSVGEEWPVNAVAVAKQAEEMRMPGLKPEAAKGSVKFLEITSEEGKPCLRIHGKFSIDGKGMAMPNGMTVSEMSAIGEAESAFPVDVAEPILPWEKIAGKMRVVGAGEVERNGQKIKVEVVSEGKMVHKCATKRIE